MSLAAAAPSPPAVPRGGFGGRLRDRLLDWRDRLLASARFRRLAAAFPLTRGIARAETRALFDLCAGFVYSQVLAACVRLDLFRRVREAPRTAEEVAALTGLPAEGAARLLDAAVALRLLDRRSGGRYGLGALGVVVAADEGVAAMVAHHAALYRDLADPVALLRGERATALAEYWPYAGAEDAASLAADRVADYSALMAASQPMVAAEILAAGRLDRFRSLLDVGGGEGAFLAAVAARHPGLSLALFDLPAVAERARARLAACGVRAEVFAGDFRRDPIPRGFDAITLVRIAHDHDDATVSALFRAVRRALPPGGTLLLAEPLAGTKGAEPVGDAYFGLYLWAMGRGRPRTADTYRRMLAEAGFAAVHERPTRIPLLVRVLEARAGQTDAHGSASVNHA
ncbi:acetylserotonin O-methyltransferase [Elioraea thermophila]|uniref:acetylserotonin O-methyltransferase n=1 Tax=Elioraea thermophila TaxID=2185104 RepID=UPI001E44E8AD|nr:acetylserotonin O-methyltransferase [Elioraea thermophila]